MDSSRYSELYHTTHGDLGLLQPRTPDLRPEQHPFDQSPHNLVSHYARTDCLVDIPPTQNTAAYDPLGTFSVQDNWHQLQAGHGPLANDKYSLTDIFPVQPQCAYLSYAEKAIQTGQSDPLSENNNIQEQTPRDPVPQKTYKPNRQPTNFGGPNTIEFCVGGKEGIRLSDALEGNWAGLEGRDDRSLFEGDRPQIAIRLHLVGCPPWQSKIPTTDFTAKRRPVTRMRLATEVAKSIRKFIAREKLIGHGGSHPRCGWGDVLLENVFLTRMVRVSVASWQPEIFVERLSVTSQTTSSPDPLARTVSGPSRCGFNATWVYNGTQS